MGFQGSVFSRFHSLLKLHLILRLPGGNIPLKFSFSCLIILNFQGNYSREHFRMIDYIFCYLFSYSVPRYWFAFACNAKSFGIVIVFNFFTGNLNGVTKTVSIIFLV